MTGNGKIDELIAEVFFNEIYIDVGQDQELKYHRDGFDAMFVFFSRCDAMIRWQRNRDFYRFPRQKVAQKAGNRGGLEAGLEAKIRS